MMGMRFPSHLRSDGLTPTSFQSHDFDLLNFSFRCPLSNLISFCTGANITSHSEGIDAIDKVSEFSTPRSNYLTNKIFRRS
jgi:hypothetical protein